jgi:hypothetical protein
MDFKAINKKYRKERKIDLLKYLPKYVNDEEIAGFIDILSDVMNNMYEASAKYHKTDTVLSTMTTFEQNNDTSELLFNYGAGNYSGNLTDSYPQNLEDGEWPYTESFPTNDQINGANGEDMINTSPALGVSDINYPDSTIGPNNIQDLSFDRAAPIDVDNTIDNQTSELNTNPFLDNSLVPVYDNRGLHEPDAENQPINVPNFNNYYETKNEVVAEKTTMSILEKIYSILDNRDAGNIDFEYIQYFANYLGYDTQLNTLNNANNILISEAELGYELTDYEKNEYVQNQIRSVVENLPHWYKIKGTDDALSILMYSFGLVVDIRNYYTKNYSTDRRDWFEADKYYNTSANITEANRANITKDDLTDVPDDWFPTPHFSLAFDIAESFTNKTKIFSDKNKYEEMINAIMASKPITTVFEGLVATFKTNRPTHLFCYSYTIDRRYSSVFVSGTLENTYELDEFGQPTATVIDTNTYIPITNRYDKVNFASTAINNNIDSIQPLVYDEIVANSVVTNYSALETLDTADGGVGENYYFDYKTGILVRRDPTSPTTIIEEEKTKLSYE